MQVAKPDARLRGKETRWTGYIEVVENARVNVPLEFRKAIESAPRSIPPRPCRAADRRSR